MTQKPMKLQGCPSKTLISDFSLVDFFQVFRSKNEQLIQHVICKILNHDVGVKVLKALPSIYKEVHKSGLEWSMTWPALDPYGQKVIGRTLANIKVGYQFRCGYSCGVQNCYLDCKYISPSIRSRAVCSKQQYWYGTLAFNCRAVRTSCARHSPHGAGQLSQYPNTNELLRVYWGLYLLCLRGSWDFYFLFSLLIFDLFF